MPTGHNANQRLAFCPDFFLWLAFCPSQLFGWHFVRIMKITFQITFHEKAKSICKTGSDNDKLSQLLRTLCNAEELRKQLDTMRRLFFLNVSDEAEQELVTEQIKSIVRKLQQIQGDSGVRRTLLLAKSSGIISNFQNLSVLSDLYAGDVPDGETGAPPGPLLSDDKSP